ncbi:RDD family protein [Rhodocytophaga rosea]|uniref:RDD family protein n=1 Tax=Rhodocytophaga rosea TaxID=2704465 RepID=A0A6C0GJQ9_9BACT|nr:RDD family protein [Rhodocytophaga rosea]QHT68177.1 RDD family protein [Rhodocytophaga rosea]
MPTTKQFNLTHLKIDDSLQGSSLASFGRRTIAFIIDWVIIFACTQYLWLTALVIFALVMMRKKYKTAFLRNSILIRNNIHKLDEHLEKYDVEQSLRSQFKKHLTWYMYLIIYGPIVVSIVIAAGIVLGMLSPTEYGAISEKQVQGAMLFHPFKDVYNVFTFFGGLLSGMLYFSLFTWKWQGQTPGKRLMKIKVVKLNGTPITLWNSFERFSGYSSSASSFLLGFFQYYWDTNHQTTHDKISETIVVQA